MSEADTSMNGPELPELNNLTAAQTAAFLSESLDAEMVSEPSDTDSLEDDWQTVDFPNALSVDAIAHSPEELPTDELSIQPAASSVALSQADLVELLSLMQDLQHRNSYLLGRVNQLEAVLNDCQSTLEAQAVRTQEQETVLAQQTEEMLAAEEHIHRLMHELDCAHQATQRQQILIETVTGQLESSQERVAQLERECALTQQRYNEQTHSLLQSENICRDLRSRLHRQQRYTLQFKAALEKCLDISSPCQENNPDLNLPTGKTRPAQKHANEPGLFPKAASIKPWSADPWLVNADLPTDAELEQDNLVSSKSSVPSHAEVNAPPDLASPLLDLSPSLSALLHDVLAATSSETQADEQATPVNPEPAIAPPPAATSISYDLKKKEPDSVKVTAENEETPAATLEDVDAILLEVVGASFTTGSAEFGSPSEEAIADDINAPTWEPDLDSEAEPETELHQPEPAPTESSFIAELEIPPEMSDDPIWQDLAKLIDTPVEPQPTEEEQLVAAQDEAAHDPGFSVYPSWPSPVVYPLRHQKKRSSLAAVELPSFRQPPA